MFLYLDVWYCYSVNEKKMRKTHIISRRTKELHDRQFFFRNQRLISRKTKELHDRQFFLEISNSLILLIFLYDHIWLMWSPVFYISTWSSFGFVSSVIYLPLRRCLILLLSNRGRIKNNHVKKSNIEENERIA